MGPIATTTLPDHGMRGTTAGWPGSARRSGRPAGAARSVRLQGGRKRLGVQHGQPRDRPRQGDVETLQPARLRAGDPTWLHDYDVVELQALRDRYGDDHELAVAGLAVEDGMR